MNAPMLRGYISRRCQGPPPTADCHAQTCLVLLTDGAFRVTTLVGRGEHAFWADLNVLRVAGQSVIAHWWLRTGGPSSCPPAAVARLGQASLDALAREFCVSVTVVQRWRREHGVVVPCGRRPGFGKHDDATFRAGLERRHPGLTHYLEAGGKADRAVCEKHSLSRERIRQIRVRLGLEPWGKPPSDLAAFAAAVSDSATLQEAATRLSLHDGQVRARAKRHGIKLPQTPPRRKKLPSERQWPPREGTQLCRLYNVLVAYPEGVRADTLVCALQGIMATHVVATTLYRWRKGGRITRSGRPRDGLRYGYTYQLSEAQR